MEQTPVDKLDEVIQEALTQNSITPLVKMELANKVRERRSMDGKGDIVVTFDPPKVYQLSEEERYKIETRKSRNRRSAEKARIKRKQHEENVENELKQLENEQQSLNSEIQQLNMKKEKYKQILYAHLLAVRTKRTHCRFGERLMQSQTLMNT